MKLITSLEVIDDIIGNRGNCLQRCPLDHETRFGTLRLSLGADLLTLGLDLSLELIILDFPKAELLSAPRWHNMLHTHVNPLPYDSVADLNETSKGNFNKHQIPKSMRHTHKTLETKINTRAEPQSRKCLKIYMKGNNHAQKR